LTPDAENRSCCECGRPREASRSALERTERATERHRGGANRDRRQMVARRQVQEELFYRLLKRDVPDEISRRSASAATNYGAGRALVRSTRSGNRAALRTRSTSAVLSGMQQYDWRQRPRVENTDRGAVVMSPGTVISSASGHRLIGVRSSNRRGRPSLTRGRKIECGGSAKRSGGRWEWPAAVKKGEEECMA